jgi:hypothetical protein
VGCGAGCGADFGADFGAAGFGVKKLEMDCCFVFCDELDEKGLLFGAIADNSDVIGCVDVDS